MIGWLDDVLEDLRRMDVRGYTEMAMDRLTLGCTAEKENLIVGYISLYCKEKIVFLRDNFMLCLLPKKLFVLYDYHIPVIELLVKKKPYGPYFPS